jgi:hypothetical protein
MFKQKLFPAVIFLGLALTVLLISQSTNEAKVAAAFPLGQWTFESTTDSTGVFYSTNGACIQAGTWYATTSGKGSGHWYMKGTSIHLHGNYAGSASGGGVNDSFELNVINPKLLTGYLQEWNDAGSYNGYYRSKWAFVSATCNPPSK